MICNLSFTAAHLQQNSHPERRPREDLIDWDQAALPASHEPTDTCPNCLHHLMCNVSKGADCFGWHWLKAHTAIITCHISELPFSCVDLSHWNWKIYIFISWLSAVNSSQENCGQQNSCSISLVGRCRTSFCCNNIHLQCFFFVECMQLWSLFNKDLLYANLILGLSWCYTEEMLSNAIHDFLTKVVSHCQTMCFF